MSWLFLIRLFLDIPFSVNAGIPGDAEMADIKPNTAEGHNYSATLNIMHSYIASKSSKEEEKRKLQRRNAELKAEREQLETKSQQLKLNMQVGFVEDFLVSWLSFHSPIHAFLSPFFGLQAQNDQHELLVTAHETIQGQVEKLKNFLKLFQTC